jgi:general secretion pathway protein B
MSYILDALRKSEQQRQATQPDNVTDRILVSQPQPKPKRAKWLIALVAVNLVAIASVAWYFTHKTTPENQPTQAVNTATQNQGGQKPVITQVTKPTLKKTAPTPSIAQLMENQKTPEPSKPAKKIPVKEPQPAKKEVSAKATLTSRNVTKPINDEPVNETPTVAKTRPKTNGTPDLNELPYEVRNNLPNLNVNVFSYAQQPEDRFVIIDMVKYKTGQLVKGQVKLKEIRPDSIVLENTDGSTFKVERP